MMENTFLLSSLEEVLGKSKKTSKDNYAFTCPFCQWKNPKLEIKISTNEHGSNPWGCWRCGEKGGKIRTLLRKMRLPTQEVDKVLKYVRNGETYEYIKTEVLELPQEFKPLYHDTEGTKVGTKAKNYLYDRGLTEIDFIKYNIGYCSTGIYSGRVIVPSYTENNELNYFIARSFDGAYRKHLAPETNRDVIFFESLINWSQPIILCEGVFDAMAIKRNAIPLLGKNLSKSLQKKIITSKVEDIYIALDKDAMDKALVYCEKFLNMGKKVYLVDIDDKDPSEMGFRPFTQFISKVDELDLSKLMEYKLEIV